MKKENENKKEFWKSKKVWRIIGAIALVCIVFGVGNSSAKVELEDGKVDYDGLTSKIEEKNKELEDIQKKLDKEESKLNEKQTEVKEAFAAIDNKDKLADEVNSLEDDLSTKQGELDELNGDIKDKQKELDSLNSKIVEAKGKPVELLSGQWVVGHDIDSGRYQASGSSNFVVYNSSGQLKVNTILGSNGDGDYVFFAEDGDIIEASSQTTLTPVE